MTSLRTPALMVSLGLGLSAAVVLGVACKPDKEAETGGYLQAGFGAAGGGGAAAYPGGAGGQPAGWGAAGSAATPVGGAAAGGAPTAAGGVAQPIDPAAATILQPVLIDLAKSHTVAGSKPLGAPMVGTFQAGQTLEGQIQLQPQKCYTVVGTALPPVTDLDVQIVLATPLPNLAPVLAIDTESGTTSVVGKKPNCYKWAMPMATPAKVVVKVVAGSGMAAAQVYEK